MTSDRRLSDSTVTAIMHVPLEKVNTFGLLCRLSPNSETVTEFPKITARVWASQMGDAEQRAKKITAQIAKVKGLKSRLLEAFLQGNIPQDDYQTASADSTRQIAELERQLRDVSSITASADAFTWFAELQLADLAGLWQRAHDDQRRRVQPILFKNGLAYSPQTKSLNPGNTTLFRMLEQMNPKNLRLASRPRSFEPCRAAPSLLASLQPEGGFGIAPLPFT